MKTTQLILTVIATLLGSATTALAAAAREDHSGIFVWVFLGFCALIVVAQVIPAVLMMFGIAKGIASQPMKEQKSAEELAPK